jgi:hypothetical protein
MKKKIKTIYNNKNELKQSSNIYYDVQDVRKRSFNRLLSVGVVKGVYPTELKRLELSIRKDIEINLEKYPIWTNYLCNVKGIGATLGGNIIGTFDIRRANHISSFWKFCGLHTNDGKAIKRTKGVKLDFNIKNRAMVWNIGKSLIRCNNPQYRNIYDQRKVVETTKLNNPIDDPKNCPMYKECYAKIGHKPSCKLHIHNRAMRYMIKMFLSDLWVNWRKIEGLSVTPPYMHRNDTYENSK